MGISRSRFKGIDADTWEEWLNDRPSSKAEPVKPAKKAADTATKTIAIHVTLPKFKKPNIKIPAGLLTRRNAVYVGIMVIGLSFITFGVIGIRHKANTPSTKTKNGTKQISATPTFQAVLPEKELAKTVDNRTAYDAQKGVVSFADTIYGVNVTVSEQELPDDFKKNPDESVKKLAESFSANETIATSTPTAYLGTSIKGPQTVIFHKNGLLIFIQSASKIEKTDWAEYITKLQ